MTSHASRREKHHIASGRPVALFEIVMFDLRLYASLVVLLSTAMAATAACGPRETKSANVSSTASSPSQLSDVAGHYSRTEPSSAEVRLSRTAGSEFFVVIQAGGLPNGMATAATCTVGGPARWRGTILVVDAAILEDPDAGTALGGPPDEPAVQLTLQLTVDGILVSGEQAAGRLCAPGSYLDGLYRRDEF